MAKVLISPGKYVQGAGEMKKLGEYAQNYGKKALILISKGGYKRIGAMVEKSFEGKECGYVFDYFNGECSKKEIKRLGEIVKKEACDVVIGIGGGKIFDTAKAVAYYEKTPVLICPTIASTDAPCSALSVIYTEEGVFEEYLFLPSNPDMVMFALPLPEWEMLLQLILKQERVRDQMPHPVQAERLPGQLWLLQNCVLIR